MSHEIIAKKMASKYAKAGGMQAFDWLAILKALLPLLLMCLPMLAKRHAKRHPEATKEAMDLRLQEEEPDMSKKDRVAIVEAAYSTLVNATKAELESL